MLVGYHMVQLMPSAMSFLKPAVDHSHLLGTVEGQDQIKVSEVKMQAPWWWWRGGGLAQGLGIRLFAFGGACWPCTTAHSDPLWV